MTGNVDNSVLVPFLAVNLNCLPSDIYKEKAEDIQAMINVISSRHKKAERSLKRKNR